MQVLELERQAAILQNEYEKLVKDIHITEHSLANMDEPREEKDDTKRHKKNGNDLCGDGNGMSGDLKMEMMG